MVTWENYEAYMLLYVDGELNDVAQKALLDFIQLHPELHFELKMYEAAVLVPDTTQGYLNKNALLKPVAARKVIALGQWWMYGAAAGIILIMSLFALRWMNGDNGAGMRNGEIAKTETHKDKSTTSNHFQPSPALSNNKTPLFRREERISIAGNNVHSNTKELVKDNASSGKAELEPIKAIAYEMKIEAPQIELSSAYSTTISEKKEEIITVEKNKTDLLSWLPEEKKEGWQSLKENVDQQIVKAKTFKDNLKDTQLALKFGSKELVINF